MSPPRSRLAPSPAIFRRWTATAALLRPLPTPPTLVSPWEEFHHRLQTLAPAPLARICSRRHGHRTIRAPSHRLRPLQRLGTSSTSDRRLRRALPQRKGRPARASRARRDSNRPRPIPSSAARKSTPARARPIPSFDAILRRMSTPSKF
jgi:hypothetical protein